MAMLFASHPVSRARAAHPAEFQNTSRVELSDVDLLHATTQIGTRDLLDVIS